MCNVIDTKVCECGRLNRERWRYCPCCGFPLMPTATQYPWYFPPSPHPPPYQLPQTWC